MQSELPFDVIADVTSKTPITTDWRKDVPSVSQLTRRIRGHLENSFFDVWVKGEISNFRKPSSGHAYFNLKDANAQIRTVIFKSALSKLKFQLQDGQEILAHGTVTVYEPRGEYQLVCDTLEPAGLGALQLAFMQLKTRLEGEGLFEPLHKKKLPFLPQRIGVITSPTGAAIRDILKVLGRRFPNLEVFLIGASVQGEKAASEIVQAIKLAEQWNQESDRKIEVLIVGRGGGSIEDLWPFNEEIVARSLYDCSIPTISAVGHEIDFTIADFVADVRAPTPSAAAEIVVPNQPELRNRVMSLRDRFFHANHSRLRQHRLNLAHLSSRLTDPREYVKRVKERATALLEKLLLTMNTRTLIFRKRVESLVGMLHSLSPLEVIGRGYSLTRVKNGPDDGLVVRSISAVLPGQTLSTRVVDGHILSNVLSSRSHSDVK